MFNKTKINFNVKIWITKKSKKNKFINKLINVNRKINKFTKKERKIFIYESKYIRKKKFELIENKIKTRCFINLINYNFLL